MTETISADDGTIGAVSPAGQHADLRSIAINPNFWYPVAESDKVKKGKTAAATFAGERIALYRGESGTVHALEDRCAHRQVPLSMGVVEGDVLRCCYHAWAYRGDGRISQIPYLPKGAGRPPRGVRAYPAREAYGMVFVFPGDPELAPATAVPELPEFDSAGHKTMTFSRTVRCHYSFMHENLLDMNHQFLHRGILGRIKPELLGYDTGRNTWRPATFSRIPAARKTAGPACSPASASAAANRLTSSPSARNTPIRPSSWSPITPGFRRSPCGSPTYRRMPSSA